MMNPDFVTQGTGCLSGIHWGLNGFDCPRQHTSCWSTFRTVAGSIDVHKNCHLWEDHLLSTTFFWCNLINFRCWLVDVIKAPDTFIARSSEVISVSNNNGKIYN